MDDRGVSRLIRMCVALAFVIMAGFICWDTSRTLSMMSAARPTLANALGHLVDIGLQVPATNLPDREQVHAALAGLNDSLAGYPALHRRVAALQAGLQDPAQEQAARIAALAAEVRSEAGRSDTALQARFYADIAALALLSGLLSALAALSWRGGSSNRGAADQHDNLLHQAVQALPYPFCMVDRDGQPVIVNAAAQRLWTEDLAQQREWRRPDLEMRPENRALFLALRRGTERAMDPVDIVAQDGATKRLMVSAAPLRDAKRKVAGAFAIYLDSSATALAASGPHQAQAAGIATQPLPDFGSENRSGAVQPAHVFLLDHHGKILMVNQPLIEFSGMDCTGSNYLDVCASSAGQGIAEAARIAAGIRSVAAGEMAMFSMEYICRSADEFFWCRATVSRMASSGTPYILVVHENITQHKATESALRASAVSMRELAEHQESVREEERKRIAREIHDELGQQLLALKIDVSILQGQLSHVPQATAQLDGMLRSMTSLMQSMRAIINDLRPAVLDLGLHAAVEWQTREFQRKTGIACTLLSDGEDIALPDACATALFRTLQESLTNVSRHAHASRVDVQLYTTEESLLMRISDDGIGQLGKQDKPEAFGLRGMRERIGSLGGKLTITAAPDQGVTVTAAIPLSQDLQMPQPGFDRRSATDRRAHARVN
jgi:PAS domain S-box-containing protein